MAMVCFAPDACGTCAKCYKISAWEHSEAPVNPPRDSRKKLRESSLLCSAHASRHAHPDRSASQFAATSSRVALPS